MFAPSARLSSKAAMTKMKTKRRFINTGTLTRSHPDTKFLNASWLKFNFACRFVSNMPPHTRLQELPDNRLKPLRKSPLVVAAVYDRRDLRENHHPSALTERRYRAFAEVSNYLSLGSIA